MEKSRVDLLEQLMPRLTGLSEKLEDVGIENDVLMSVESLPAVLAEVDGRQLRLTYVPVEAGGYLLSITGTVLVSEDGEEGLMEWCDWFNENSLLAMACLDPLGKRVIFKCGVPEPEEIDDSGMVKAVLDVFLEDILRFEG